MLDYVKIGENIRFYRKRNGLSQEQLAEKVWISVTHMSHIETGQTKLSLPVLVDLANALGVTPNDLLLSQFVLTPSESADSEAILSQCTPAQAAVLCKILHAAKAALDQYRE